jgi:hypothetical protein
MYVAWVGNARFDVSSARQKVEHKRDDVKKAQDTYDTAKSEAAQAQARASDSPEAAHEAERKSDELGVRKAELDAAQAKLEAAEGQLRAAESRLSRAESALEYREDVRQLDEYGSFHPGREFAEEFFIFPRMEQSIIQQGEVTKGLTKQADQLEENAQQKQDEADQAHQDYESKWGKLVPKSSATDTRSWGTWGEPNRISYGWQEPSVSGVDTRNWAAPPSSIGGGSFGSSQPTAPPADSTPPPEALPGNSAPNSRPGSTPNDQSSLPNGCTDFRFAAAAQVANVIGSASFTVDGTGSNDLIVVSGDFETNGAVLTGFPPAQNIGSGSGSGAQDGPKQDGGSGAGAPPQKSEPTTDDAVAEAKREYLEAAEKWRQAGKEEAEAEAKGDRIRRRLAKNKRAHWDGQKDYWRAELEKLLGKEKADRFVHGREAPNGSAVTPGGDSSSGTDSADAPGSQGFVGPRIPSPSAAQSAPDAGVKPTVPEGPVSAPAITTPPAPGAGGDKNPESNGGKPDDQSSLRSADPAAADSREQQEKFLKTFQSAVLGIVGYGGLNPDLTEDERRSAVKTFADTLSDDEDTPQSTLPPRYGRENQDSGGGTSNPGGASPASKPNDQSSLRSDGNSYVDYRDARSVNAVTDGLPNQRSLRSGIVSQLGNVGGAVGSAPGRSASMPRLA